MPWQFLFLLLLSFSLANGLI